MLHIILLILKIILFIILGILGLLLLILGILLFAPIRYKASLLYKEKIKVKAKIRFLFISLNVIYDQASNEVSNIVSIFGIKFSKKDTKENYAKKHNKSKKNEIKDDSEKTISESDKALDVIEDDKVKVFNVYKEDDKVKALEVSEDDKVKDLDADEIKKTEKNEPETKKEIDELTKKQKKKDRKEKKEKKQTKKLAKKEKNKYKFEQIKQKVLYIKKKYRDFQKFMNHPCTIKTRKYLKKYIPKTLKHIFPRRVKGYLRYGMNEPYKTGKLTGYLSLMPFVYHKHFSLVPDFHNKVIEADIKLKGRIRLGYIIRITLHMHVWRTIKAAKRI